MVFEQSIDKNGYIWSICIEVVVNKQPPFGNHVKRQAAHTPAYSLSHGTVAGTTSSHRITLKLINLEKVEEFSTAGKRHSGVLMIGEGKWESIDFSRTFSTYFLQGLEDTNEILTAVRVTVASLIERGGFYDTEVTLPASAKGKA